MSMSREGVMALFGVGRTTVDRADIILIMLLLDIEELLSSL